MFKHRTTAGLLAGATATILTLGACAPENSTQSGSGEGSGDGSGRPKVEASGDNDLGIDFSSLAGTLNGSGASSQGKAMQAWRDGFASVSDVKVNYTETGSGTGREQFLGGEVSFIGTDAALDAEEMEKAKSRCHDAGVVELPTYISPIAVAFNVPGVDRVNLTSELIAKIFRGEVENWNDEAIAELNEDAELPDLPIVTVHRADKSGTTENFTEYLSQVVPDIWTDEPGQEWPAMDGSLSQSAEGTSGVVSLVENTPGGITYADASQIGDLGSVAVKIGEEFIPYSAEAAAKIVDGSPAADDADETVLTVDLTRDGSIEGAYPIVLVSYHVACLGYSDADEAANVQGLLAYIASEEGQQAAADHAGSAPISPEMREKANAAIEGISAV